MKSLLDHTDRQILHLLQHDARLTNKEIADKLGKTVTPVYERVKRLEQEGIIHRYVAVVDKKKIGKGLVVFTNIQLKQHTQQMLRSFDKFIVQFPEVMECYHMAGMYDYLLKIIVKDMEEYQDFILNKLSGMDNIGTVQSNFVMQEFKHETAFALPVLKPREK